MSNQVYATLVLNDEYVPGALVVGASLREVSELCMFICLRFFFFTDLDK